MEAAGMAGQRKQKRTTKRFVDGATRRMLNQEARKLGLSTNEYLRLVGKLSSALREGLSDGEPIDARKLAEWAENPLIMSMIQMVCRYAIQSVDNNDDPSADNTPKTDTGNPSHKQGQHLQVQQPQIQYIDPLYGPVPQYMLPPQQPRPMQQPPDQVR